MRGAEYPGELVYVEGWRQEYGARLRGRSMFRLVLLTKPQAVSRDDIQDPRIAVAVPGLGDAYRPAAENRGRDLAREINRLNEIRELYLASEDPGLHNLATTLGRLEKNAQADAESSLVDAWRNGTVVTAEGDGTGMLDPDHIFVGPDSASWVEAAAAALLPPPPGITPAPLVPAADIYANIGTDGPDAWLDGVNTWTLTLTGKPFEHIADALDDLQASGARSTPALLPPSGQIQEFLRHGMGMPPECASLFIAAYIAVRDGEAEIAGVADASPLRLHRHTLCAIPFSADLVDRLVWLSPSFAADWNSALPYFRHVLPDINPDTQGRTPDGEPRRLIEAAEALELRFTLATGVVSEYLGLGSRLELQGLEAA